jgi:predicted enzyme related to lactoylglutathione lyase
MTTAVTHFEIYAEQPAALADFYRDLFGWRVEQAPGVDYWRIETAPGAAPGAAKGIGGGLLFRPIPGPRSWVHYLHVPSLEQTVERLVALGGAVVRPKSAVPKTAWYAVVSDPQGNIFALWQADPLAMPPPEPED